MFPVAKGGRKLTNDVGRSPESFIHVSGKIDEPVPRPLLIHYLVRMREKNELLFCG